MPPVSLCLNAGAMGRIDAESETLIPVNRCGFDDVSHTLRGEGFDASEDGTGRGTPLVPIAFTSKDYGGDATSDVVPTLRSMGHADSHANGGGQVAIAFPAELSGTQVASAEDRSPALSVKHTMAVAFDTTQITSPGNYSQPKDGDPCHPLAATAHVPAVAFTQNQREELREIEISGALSAEPGTHQQAYVAQPFTIMERGREGGSNLEYRNDGTSNAILTSNGGRGGLGVGAIATQWQVRRLTVTECERLQGYPENHTMIEFGGRRSVEPDMAEYLRSKGAIVTEGNDGKLRTNVAADGPRYKALGNAWAVSCARPIAHRIHQLQEQ